MVDNNPEQTETSHHGNHHKSARGQEFDEIEFEAAKSSLVFEIIEEEKTVSNAAEQSIYNYFRGLPLNYKSVKMLFQFI